MAIRIIVVASRSKDPLDEAAQVYLDRIRHYVRCDLVVVDAQRRGRKDDDAKTCEREANEILKQVKGAQLIALDQRGRGLSSEQLAHQLERWLTQGDLAFVIGGATGLHESVMKRAYTTISLGPMTLPHRLARLVLCEQLYRAQTILRGEPYHK